MQPGEDHQIKMGVSDAWRVDQLLMQKPNRKLLSQYGLNQFLLVVFFCVAVDVYIQES
jgi:hypothetical protein